MDGAGSSREVEKASVHDLDVTALYCVQIVVEYALSQGEGCPYERMTRVVLAGALHCESTHVGAVMAYDSVFTPCELAKKALCILLCEPILVCARFEAHDEIGRIRLT
jgi:hypothetical protein